MRFVLSFLLSSRVWYNHFYSKSISKAPSVSASVRFSAMAILSLPICAVGRNDVDDEGSCCVSPCCSMAADKWLTTPDVGAVVVNDTKGEERLRGGIRFNGAAVAEGKAYPGCPLAASMAGLNCASTANRRAVPRGSESDRDNGLSVVVAAAAAVVVVVRPLDSRVKVSSADWES